MCPQEEERPPGKVFHFSPGTHYNHATFCGDCVFCGYMDATVTGTYLCVVSIMPAVSVGIKVIGGRTLGKCPYLAPLAEPEIGCQMFPAHPTFPGISRMVYCGEKRPRQCGPMYTSSIYWISLSFSVLLCE